MVVEQLEKEVRKTRFEYVSFEEEDQLLEEGQTEGLLQPVSD
jgi:hypothetical protein